MNSWHCPPLLLGQSFALPPSIQHSLNNRPPLMGKERAGAVRWRKCLYPRQKQFCSCHKIKLEEILHWEAYGSLCDKLNTEKLNQEFLYAASSLSSPSLPFESWSHTVYRVMVASLSLTKPTSVLKANCHCRAILKQSGVLGILICMTIPRMLLQLPSYFMEVLMMCLSFGNKPSHVPLFCMCLTFYPTVCI